LRYRAEKTASRSQVKWATKMVADSKALPVEQIRTTADEMTRAPQPCTDVPSDPRSRECGEDVCRMQARVVAQHADLPRTDEWSRMADQQ